MPCASQFSSRFRICWRSRPKTGNGGARGRPGRKRFTDMPAQLPGVWRPFRRCGRTPFLRPRRGVSQSASTAIPRDSGYVLMRVSYSAFSSSALRAVVDLDHKTNHYHHQYRHYRSLSSRLPSLLQIDIIASFDWRLRSCACACIVELEFVSSACRLCGSYMPVPHAA